MSKRIAILGSTGSIGTQALEVASDQGIQIVGLTAGENTELLERQARQFHPQVVAIQNEEKAEQLKWRLKDTKTEVLAGQEGILSVAKFEEAEMVLSSIVGNAGILPTIAAIQAGKDVALANKETMVSAGQLVLELAAKNHVAIVPVDSEHSAIFQCLQANEKNPIHRILLTASGGPFYGKKKADLQHITPSQALAHPNWSMGKKISIDSATMMNKGLEVIEAKWLFDVSADQIEVLIHPQSVIHSGVEFQDGAVLAQLGMADMRIPIQYAFFYPERKENRYPRLDFTKGLSLSFSQPDTETFPCLSFAMKAIQKGGTMPAVLNGANEIAVERFLKEEISFLDIPVLIEDAMNAYTEPYEYSLEGIIHGDQWARTYGTSWTKQ